MEVFFKLPINYSIVTNIDYEHIDFYKNFENLENSFIKFIEKTPQLENQLYVLRERVLKKKY